MKWLSNVSSWIARIHHGISVISHTVNGPCGMKARRKPRASTSASTSQNTWIEILKNPLNFTWKRYPESEAWLVEARDKRRDQDGLMRLLLSTDVETISGNEQHRLIRNRPWQIMVRQIMLVFMKARYPPARNISNIGDTSPFLFYLVINEQQQLYHICLNSFCANKSTIKYPLVSCLCLQPRTLRQICNSLSIVLNTDANVETAFALSCNENLWEYSMYSVYRILFRYFTHFGLCTFENSP